MKEFVLLYHKTIPTQDLPRILDFLQQEKEQFLGENSYKRGGRSSGSFYKRGILGLLVDGFKSGVIPKYTFRRLSKHRRWFGVIPITLLERKDGQPIKLNQCHCAIHAGGQKCRIIGGLQDNDWVVYYDHVVNRNIQNFCVEK